MATPEQLLDSGVEPDNFQFEIDAEQYYEASRAYNEARTDEEKQRREALKEILIPLARQVVMAKGEPVATPVPFQRAHGEPLHIVHALRHRTPPISLNPKKYTGLGQVMETEIKAVGPSSYVVDKINIYQVAMETGERISKKSDFHISPEDNFVKDFTTANADSKALNIAIHTVQRFANELPDFQTPQEVVASS